MSEHTPYDPWDPWPSTAEQVAMTLAVPVGMNSVCSCGVPDGESEATHPDDRSQHLPHHFDCTAVTAWAVASHVYTPVTPPEQTAENETPFTEVPSGIDIARYFWHDIVMADPQVPYRRGQYHGCDGINLWREDGDYCYLWVQATADHDMWMAYLLDIRTHTGGVETRDHLYLAAGGGDLFEVVWHNQPTRPFEAPLDDNIDHYYAAMKWFVERDVSTIEDQNGGAQGIIDRAAERVIPPGEGAAPSS